jgi:putative membrane protein
MLRLTLAALHLIALGIGLGAVIARGTALREPPSSAALRRAFRSDATWGIAALLWLSTGLWRWFGGTDKTPDYYLSNFVFHTKLGLFLLVVALEIWPMITLMRWRRAFGAGESGERLMEDGAARRIATISHVQALVVVIIVFTAVAMARGYGVMGGVAAP